MPKLLQMHKIYYINISKIIKMFKTVQKFDKKRVKKTIFSRK